MTLAHAAAAASPALLQPLPTASPPLQSAACATRFSIARKARWVWRALHDKVILFLQHVQFVSFVDFVHSSFKVESLALHSSNILSLWLC